MSNEIVIFTENNKEIEVIVNPEQDTVWLTQKQIGDLYDVKQDIDVAYSNRFMPLQVNPEDVQDRWFEWAESTKTRNGEDVSSGSKKGILEQSPGARRR